MFKNFLKFISLYKIYNPFVRLILPFISSVPYINQLKRDTEIVVSLSAEEENFDTLEYTLYSIFNQKIKPDNVVLWISNKYELTDLPYSVTKYVKNGLDIRFVDDKKSFTKIIYALKEFRNCIIVTADENIYYPKQWLSKLYLSYISSPKDIHVHSARIVAENNLKPAPQRVWKNPAKAEKADFVYFPVSTGGVLYPPECFVREVAREDIYGKKVNTSWEIWSWVMALVSDRKIRLVKNHINRFAVVDGLSAFKTYTNRVKNRPHADEELAKLFEYYGNNLTRKIAQK